MCREQGPECLRIRVKACAFLFSGYYWAAALSLETFEAGQGQRHLDWTREDARRNPTRPCLRRTTTVGDGG